MTTGRQLLKLLRGIGRGRSQLLKCRHGPLGYRFVVAARLHQLHGRRAGIFTLLTQFFGSTSPDLDLLVP